MNYIMNIYISQIKEGRSSQDTFFGYLFIVFVEEN